LISIATPLVRPSKRELLHFGIIALHFKNSDENVASSRVPITARRTMERATTWGRGPLAAITQLMISPAHDDQHEHGQ
jgi:hypothetical protein